MIKSTPIWHKDLGLGYVTATLIMFLLFCAPNGVFAQEADTNIIAYPDVITFRLGISNAFNAYTLTDQKAGLNATISPNQEIKSTFSLMFRFIEIDIGYTPTFLKFNHDDDLNGKTKFFSLGTRFYVNQWIQNLELSKTKGYYISSKDLGFPDQNNILFPDLRVFKVGGSTSYSFNPDFSFRAIFKQTEWQRRSSGSFVSSLSYYYTEFKNPGEGKDQYVDIAAGPAYFYNWIIVNKFMVSAGAFGGIGYSNVHSSGFTDGTASSTVDGINYRTEFTIALGYNTPKFFTGLNLNINSFYHNLETDFRIDDQQQFLEFHLGYRFDAPKKWVRKVDDVEKKIGI